MSSQILYVNKQHCIWIDFTRLQKMQEYYLMIGVKYLLNKRS